MKQTKAHNGQVTVTAKSYLFLSCQQITVNFGYCTCHLLWYGLMFITFYFPCPNVYRMDLKAPALFLTCVSVSCYMTEPVFITDCPHSETGSSTRKKQWITYTFYTTDWIKVCFYSFEIWGLQFWFFFFLVHGGKCWAVTAATEISGISSEHIQHYENQQLDLWCPNSILKI